MFCLNKVFFVYTYAGHKYDGVKFEKGNCGVSIMRSGRSFLSNRPVPCVFTHVLMYCVCRWGHGAGPEGLLQVNPYWQDFDPERWGDAKGQSLLCQISSWHQPKESSAYVPHPQWVPLNFIPRRDSLWAYMNFDGIIGNISLRVFRHRKHCDRSRTCTEWTWPAGQTHYTTESLLHSTW